MISLKNIDIADLKPAKEMQWHKYSKFYEIIEDGKLVNYAINMGFQRSTTRYKYSQFGDFRNYIVLMPRKEKQFKNVTVEAV